MAIARKSDVSAMGSWFQKAIQSRRNRRFSRRHRQSMLQTLLTKSVLPSKTSAISAPVPGTNTVRRKKVSTQLGRDLLPSEKKRVHESSTSKVEASPLRGKISSGERSPVNPTTGLVSSTEGSSQDTLSNIPVVPNSGAMPLWLLRLHTIHRHSSIMTFLFVTVTLVVYGWTVYSQQTWSQAYRHLQNLQHHERQLRTINEVLKEKMAQEAQRPSAGLVSPTPNMSIFLHPDSVGSNSVSPNTTLNSESQQQTANTVINY